MLFRMLKKERKLTLLDQIFAQFRFFSMNAIKVSVLGIVNGLQHLKWLLIKEY